MTSNRERHAVEYTDGWRDGYREGFAAGAKAQLANDLIVAHSTVDIELADYNVMIERMVLVEPQEGE